MKQRGLGEAIEVALLVGDTLRRAGITAVLTGGTCASLHSRGAYSSLDVDFILAGAVSQVALDQAMASAGFRRKADRYLHSGYRVYVEFPRGPLAIGNDLRITPIRTRRGSLTTLSLSATDSCMDRLAAFYHWNDRSGLRAAVEIAARRPVSMKRIASWSRTEGARAAYQQFLTRLAEERPRRTPSARATLRRKRIRP